MEYLPEPIFHRILSFLTGKEAARTTLVSKTWRSAWLTRPDLHFDEKDHSEPQEFFDVVSKCMKWYVQSNLNIQSFGLIMQSSDPAANEFIVEALRIGATRLAIRTTCSLRNYVLPNEVFASENLVDLSVKLCTIRDVCPSSVRCSRLRTLTLDHVTVENNVMANILSHCRRIEKLSIFDRNEYQYSFRPKIIIMATVGGDCPISLPKMHNLRSLLVSNLRFTTLFKGDLSSSKFPALNDLTIQCCPQGFIVGDDPLQISNHSLEQLNFVSEGLIVTAEFDLPSIRKFTYKGSAATSLSFKPTAKDWESHLSIECYLREMSWFQRMKKFLTRLSLSTKIYLSLNVNCSITFDYDTEDVRGFPKPQVENLTIDTSMNSIPSLSLCALFDGLFRICSPKSITQYLVPESRRPSDGNWKTNNHFLCRALVQKMTGKRIVRTFCMDGLDDLSEASLHIWDVVGGEWHEVVPLESLLDAPGPRKKQKIQFQLGWK